MKEQRDNENTKGTAAKVKEREERFKRILKKTIENNQDLLLELSQQKTDRNIPTTYPKVRNRKLRISRNHRELTEEYRNTRKEGTREPKGVHPKPPTTKPKTEIRTRNRL